MTHKEAVEILKGNFINVQLLENESHADKFAEAFNMAIEALEKQVPKKPKHIGKIDEDGNAEVECDCFASQDVAIKTIKRVYCWRCGRLLDWSD